MNTKDFKEEIKIHLEARYPILWLVSFEERRVERIVEELCGKEAFVYWSWSVSKGLYGGEKKKKEPVGREKILTAIEEKIMKSDEINNLFILKDVAGYFPSHEFLRKFRDLPGTMDDMRSMNTVCILSPTLGEIPPELEEDIVVIELSLPDYDEIEEMVTKTYGHLIPKTWHASTRSVLYKSLQGLSMDNIKRVVRKSIGLNEGVLNEDCIQYIQDEKQQIIKKQQILDYYPHKETIDHIGGLEELKEWFIGREHIFRLAKDKIETLGLDIPKGLMLIGVPGSGKSLCCKALAGIWNLPLLRMDVGRVFGSTVGESEKNIRRCIQLAEAVSPCILWIDEIDKAFGGISGFQGDSGTQLRVFGTFITWLQEKEKPVFVIATANDPKNLPPELWRKGRYDEVFFVDLPSLEERADIFRIHLERKGQKPSNFNLTELASNTQGYTGAEIEQAVKDAIVITFNEVHVDKDIKEADEAVDELSHLDVSRETLLDSIRNITPLSVLKKEDIEALREWSRQRARPASRAFAAKVADELTDEEKRTVSVHEAGHTIMMWHHAQKLPVFVSVDEHKDASVFITRNEAQTTTLTKRDLEMELGIILGGMVAEDELSGENSKTIGTAHDVTEATAKARRMVVEYGFGDIMNNTSLVELQDYAMMSGKEILDDIQKILSSATSETEALLSKNKDILSKLTEELVVRGTMNSDDLLEFFKTNKLG